MADTTASTLAEALRDRYRLERELGRGGMATVYLAQDLKHDRPVALKVLRPELAATLGPDRFLREIRMAARLQHPHILTVLDSGDAAGRLWFTMPYVEGESLRDRLVRERQLPVPDAVRIATEAALALDFAHRHGVIHRDIKPENILLCDGQSLLADFGVARALGSAAPGDRLTETGMVLGTPAYMSPEQASGDSSLDTRTDIYSLGLVLYEMLAGELPFSGPTAQAILARQLADAPRPLRTVRETVPAGVEAAVLRALAKAPADRFPTAADFARALAAQEAPPAGPAPAHPPARGRPSARILAAAGVALALLGTVAMLALQAPDEEPRAMDTNLVAVAPFDVLDPALELWREGLVDLLARNLDGAGPLRTVSPTVVIRRWEGRADRTSAAALANGTGAGLAVYGTLVGRGQDSVRLTASVLDAERGSVLGEVEVRGSRDAMDELTDSVTVSILRDLSRSRPIQAARTGGLGSRSLPALRAFLRGEQFFRRTDWDSASASYERAVGLDTAFALAYWRLGTIRTWRAGGDSLATAYVQRAAALNQGLPPRESLLVVSDSLLAATGGGLPGSANRGYRDRLFNTTELVTARYPTDPEAWVALGEARAHIGQAWGTSDAMRLEPFERAIRLDSAYAPAYIHAIEFSLWLNDAARARRYAARFLELKPASEQAVAARATALILESGARGPAIQRLLDTMPVEALVQVWNDFSQATDSNEVGVEVTRRWANRHVTEQTWYREPRVRYGSLAAQLAFRGHLAEAARLVSAYPELRDRALFAELALMGALKADTADAVYRRQLHQEPFWSPSEPFQKGLVFALAWWGAREDSISLKRYLERMTWSAQADTATLGAGTRRYWVAVGQSYLALARRDTATALTRFSALPDSSGPVWFERLTLARLLASRGREREGLAVLDREFPQSYAVGPSRGLWALERARLAERVGEREKAKQWYGYVAALWRNADPELQPSVTEAKQALARLAGEPGA